MKKTSYTHGIRCYNIFPFAACMAGIHVDMNYTVIVLETSEKKDSFDWKVFTNVAVFTSLFVHLTVRTIVQ